MSVTSGNNQQRHTLFKTIMWLMPFLWVKDIRVRCGIAASLFFTLFTIIFNTCIPLIFKAIINYCATDLTGNNLTAQFLFISYGIAWTLSQIVQQFNFMAIIPALERGQRMLNVCIFRHIHALSMRFHTDKKTGTLTNALDRTQAGFDAIFWALFLFIIPISLEMIIIGVIFVRLYDISYSGILVITTVCYFLFSTVIQKKLDLIQTAYNQKRAEASETFVDSVLNVETVKYFYGQLREYEKFDTILQQQEVSGVMFHRVSCLYQLGQKSIIGLGLTVLTWKAGSAVLAHTMSIGDFILINSYVLQFTAPLSSFGYVARQVKKGVNDLGEIMNLLQRTPEISDQPDAINIDNSTGSILFHDVNFSYTPERFILKNISFSVPHGKTVALVGPTGSGKSTITKLLFRLYDVQSGAITYNNHDIRTVTQQSLHNAIGIVSQDTHLFNNTLYYNIAYGSPVATQQEVEAAIERAHLQQFIALLPDGYNTIVGERGVKLSGGEKQRVAIARVILKNPAIYVFDEATSNLDNSTERVLQENLQAVAAQKTTLIIAHRLSTIMHADEIIVLDGGVIKERGTHGELIGLRGLYYDLWSKQETTRSYPSTSSGRTE